MSTVFLGGTCDGSTWRDELIPLLTVDYFNPVARDWDQDGQAIEGKAKSLDCDIHLYVITSDKIDTLSIAEVIESVMTHGKAVIFHIIPKGLNEGQLKPLYSVVNMVKKHGGLAYVDDGIHRAARVINQGFSDNLLNRGMQIGYRAIEDGIKSD